jgi:dTDP-4-dehydrorhamnose reductase
MRVLILGAAGMLGHKLYQMLSLEHQVSASVRGRAESYRKYHLFDETHLIEDVDVSHDDSLIALFGRTRPEAVINAVGIIKQLKAAHDPLLTLSINAMLPHRLARLCAVAGARLIHISTDCVFSGRKGGYTEQDISDAEDLYGRTKFLGETTAPNALTLRTSIIGRELASCSGLIEWFLGERGGQVKGFRRAIYTGLTTRALARIIVRLLQDFPELSGLYQVSSDPINKYDLLCLVRDIYDLSIQITPDDAFDCNRSLDSSLFRSTTGIAIPSWPDMIGDMHNDPTPYDEWRRPS